MYHSNEVNVFYVIPANTPRVFHFETAWKRPFTCRLNVEYTWCVLGSLISILDKANMILTVALKDLLYFKVVLQVKQSKHLHPSLHVNSHATKNVRIWVRESPYPDIFYTKYYATLLKTYMMVFDMYNDVFGLSFLLHTRHTNLYDHSFYRNKRCGNLMKLTLLL